MADRFRWTSSILRQTRSRLKPEFCLLTSRQTDCEHPQQIFLEFDATPKKLSNMLAPIEPDEKVDTYSSERSFYPVSILVIEKHYDTSF